MQAPATTYLLTADDVAALLGVTAAWVYAQSRAGSIPTVKLGRYYRYRREAIDRWIERQEVGA
jgi:excisionase family DNA binding protein